MIITVTWLTIAIVTLVLYLHRMYSKLSKEGVNHLPVVPLFGNSFRSLLMLENLIKPIERVAHAFPEDKVVGIYAMLAPLYILQDVELIKRVTIKDFEHFVDRRSFATEFDLFGRGLLNLKGDEWKEMRSSLSPAFTSSKIRLMVPFMVEIGEKMNKVLNEKIKDSGKGYIDLELKDLTTRYATDVIASCAFGLNVDSQTVDNPFYLKSKDVTNFKMFQILKIFFFASFPSIAKMLNITISSPETSNFFQDVVLTTMADREKKNIIRPDMINLLSEIKKGNLTHEKTSDIDAGFATVEESTIGKKASSRAWTDFDLVAQAVLFLFAGFDTVSTAMTFTLYELASNPDIQNKLANEIREHHAKNDGKIDFNSIQNLKYLDMVVSENLRLYPPGAFIDRVCVKDYNIGRPNKKSKKDLIIHKGDVIGLPFWTIHRHPKLFPNPDKFDPERFSEENRHNIKPFSYMPFGLGPRNCIGSRFALCEVKVMLYHLLRVMEVIPCNKTIYPPKLVEGFTMAIKNGAWVRLQPRK